MKITFEHSNDEHCEELETFKEFAKNCEENGHFPKVKFDTKIVPETKNYYWINIDVDNDGISDKEMHGLRMDGLSNFLSKYYKVL